MKKIKTLIPKEKITKGYKVTDSDFSCNGMIYELDKIFTHEGEIEICKTGFHFCEISNDCFNYYSFKSTNRVFEVEAYGELQTEGDKHCCNKIKFMREIAWVEVLKLVNSGKENTGRTNSGDRNSGDCNSGDCNSGDCNSGYRNSGYRNSGNRNSGDCNSGYRNSGNRNLGNRNSGNCNSGDCNSGYRNSGNRNSGDCNSGYRNSGAFCLDNNPYLMLFDKPTKIKVKDWENMDAYRLMQDLNPTIWVSKSIMTDTEKKQHPKYETTDGYLKIITLKEAWVIFWGNLDEDKKDLFTSLPNFDNKKFEAITGVII